MAIPSTPSPGVSFASVRRLLSRWYSGLLLALAIAYGVAYAMHWDDRAVLLVQEAFQSKAERDASVWLPDYKVVIDAKVLPGMADDEASDLAYNPTTRTLFAVMGKNPFLVELSLKGDVLRKIPMEGWSNPEGVTILNDGLVAFTDERQQVLSIIKVDADTTRLRLVDAVKYDLGQAEKKNKGFEGVIWDAQHQQLLLGQERPVAMFSWKSDGSALLNGEKQRLGQHDLDVRNLSSLSMDPRTGHVLVLSADSHVLLELDEQGKQVSFMSLLGGMNGLKDTIPRAEGVAIDEQGTLYMVSEPNLFYSFSKK